MKQQHDTRSGNAPLSQEQLEAMIEQYFDCKLSDDDERRLRCELASTTFSSETIDEARFTMGFLSMGMARTQARREPAPRWHKSWMRVAAAAAAVALVVSAGLYVTRMATTPPDACYAWVNGHKVSDDKVVMRMIQRNFDDIDRASSSVDDHMMQQLQSMGRALDADEN